MAKFSNGLQFTVDEPTQPNLVVPPEVKPAGRGNMVFSNGLSVNLDDVTTQEAIASKKDKIPDVNQLFDTYSNNTDDMAEKFFFYTRSDPRDRLEAVKNVMKTKGFQIYNPRMEDGQILFDIGQMGYPDSRQTYTLGNKGVDTQGFKEFAGATAKFIPAAIAATMAAPATAGVVAGTAIGMGAAGVTNAAVEGADYLANTKPNNIPGLPERGLGTAVATGAVEGAGGELGGRVLSGTAKYLLGKVRNILPSSKGVIDTPQGGGYSGEPKISDNPYEVAFSKPYVPQGATPEMRAALEEEWSKKIGAAIEMGASDMRLDKTTRKMFKDLRDGTEEGKQIIKNLGQQLEKQPDQAYDYAAGAYRYPLGFGQAMEKDIAVGTAGRIEKAPVLADKMKEMANNNKVNNAITLLFSDQDTIFRQKLQELLLKKPKPPETGGVPVPEVTPRIERRVKGELSGIAGQDATHPNAAYDPRFEEIGKMNDPRILDMSKKIFENEPVAIKKMFERMDLLDIMTTEGIQSRGAEVRAMLSDEYIHDAIRNSFGKFKGGKVTPENAFTKEGSAMTLNPIDETKLSIARQNAPYLSAKLSKFEQMGREMSRGRGPEQLAKPETMSVEDLMMAAKGVPSIGMMRRGWNAASSFVMPENKQVIADLMASRVNNKRIIKAVEDLQKEKNPTTYFEKLNEIAREALPFVRVAIQDEAVIQGKQSYLDEVR